MIGGDLAGNCPRCTRIWRRVSRSHSAIVPMYTNVGCMTLMELKLLL